MDGGPDYEVPLVGESSFVSYKLSTNEIDFGEIPYNEHASKDFYIENIGKVPFEFNVNLSTVSRAGLVEAHPMTGKVVSGEKFRVVIKFFPGIPDNIDEMFLVECAHFPAERFKVRAVGTYPGCLLSFPRLEDEDFTGRFDETKKLHGKGKLAYTAVFSSIDIKQEKPMKGGGGATTVIDPFSMDIEAETDRRFLCEKILS